MKGRNRKRSHAEQLHAETKRRAAAGDVRAAAVLELAKRDTPPTLAELLALQTLPADSILFETEGIRVVEHANPNAITRYSVQIDSDPDDEHRFDIEREALDFAHALADS